MGSTRSTRGVLTVHPSRHGDGFDVVRGGPQPTTVRTFATRGAAEAFVAGYASGFLACFELERARQAGPDFAAVSA